jgi:hypothetical protein
MEEIDIGADTYESRRLSSDTTADITTLTAELESRRLQAQPAQPAQPEIDYVNTFSTPTQQSKENFRRLMGITDKNVQPDKNFNAKYLKYKAKYLALKKCEKSIVKTY